VPGGRETLEKIRWGISARQGPCALKAGREALGKQRDDVSVSRYDV